MPLSPGFRLGPYEIVSPLGAGGMGEVYRARDTRLGREVAIKVLPASLTESEQALQRFEREARTISQLSHPHICALYDVGREGETEYLVMELIEGQTLSDRLVRGPLAPDQTLRYGAEIADALEKAHRQGIVHRDLKPGNVMLTSSGVKLLDFGLARAIASPPSAPSLTALPTEAKLTEAGMVLGTVQYMAPEQLEGKDADARTDIYALGLVLYEMATGKTAFSGATRASLIGAILRDDPPPISRDQPLSPRALDRIVTTCLAKEPDGRWQTARDVALQLEGIRQERSAAEPLSAATAPRPRLSIIFPWAAAVVAAALGAWGLARGARPASQPSLMRTVLLPPPGTTLTYGANSAPAVIAPDQKRLVFGTRDADGATRLWIRDLDSSEPYPVPGTEGAFFPFWSPDGKSIGFFARGTLRLIEATRSPAPPRTLVADILEARGGSWSEDGTILYSPGNVSPIMRVPAAGGKPEPATRLEGKEMAHRWPHFLPGGRRFLYEVRQPGSGAGAAALAARLTYLASLDSNERRLVLSEDTSPIYVEPGFLLFGRANSLMAVACDPKTLQLRGEPVVLASDIEGFTAPGAPFFSATGRLLVFSQRAGARTTRMVWFDRSGKELSAVGPPAEYLSMALAPDGTHGRRDPRRGASAPGHLALRHQRGPGHPPDTRQPRSAPARHRPRGSAHLLLVVRPRALGPLVDDAEGRNGPQAGRRVTVHQDLQRRLAGRPLPAIPGVQSSDPRRPEGRRARRRCRATDVRRHRRRRDQRGLFARRPVGGIYLRRIRPQGDLRGLVPRCRAAPPHHVGGRRRSPAGAATARSSSTSARASSSPFPSPVRATISLSARGGRSSL